MTSCVCWCALKILGRVLGRWGSGKTSDKQVSDGGDLESQVLSEMAENGDKCDLYFFGVIHKLCQAILEDFDSLPPLCNTFTL